jgi:uncharacterized protein (TIGR03083 family)
MTAGSEERPDRLAAPPAGLRDRMLEAARLARTGGRPVPDAPQISPAEAFSRSADALYGTLCALDEADWRTPVLRDLDVQGLVGHLTGVEEDMHRALAGDPEVAGADHVQSTQAAALRQAGRPAEVTRQEWREEIDRTLGLVRHRDDPGGIVAMHGFPLPLNMWLVVRAFELWTHEDDIRRAVGRPDSVPDPSTLRLMTDLLATVLPLAAAQAGLQQPASVRLVLTGPGGGSWDVAVGVGAEDPVSVRIVTDAVGFCRLAARRAVTSDLDLDITGDPGRAAEVLAAASALGLD